MVHRSWRGQRQILLRQIGLLLVVPILVMSTGYALFSQQLTVNGAASSVAYVSNQYTTMKYTKTITGTGPYTYTLNPTTIKNNGVTSITAWQFTFDLPPGMTTLTCPTSVVCSQTATTVTVKNGASNGTIATGATRTFSFSFKSTANKYTLQNVAISATFSTAYQTIAGLTVVATAGPKSGGSFPLTVTITNNSGQPISGWQVTIPTTRTCTPTLPSGITYTCTTSLLTFTGAAIGIAAGAQYQFNSSVTTTMTTWVTTGAAVKGKG